MRSAQSGLWTQEKIQEGGFRKIVECSAHCLWEVLRDISLCSQASANAHCHCTVTKKITMILQSASTKTIGLKEVDSYVAMHSANVPKHHIRCLTGSTCLFEDETRSERPSAVQRFRRKHAVAPGKTPAVSKKQGRRGCTISSQVFRERTLEVLGGRNLDRERLPVFRMVITT